MAQAVESDNMQLKEQVDALEAQLVQKEHESSRTIKQLTRDVRPSACVTKFPQVSLCCPLTDLLVSPLFLCSQFLHPP